MTRWEYDITTYSVSEILSIRDRLGLSGREEGARRIFCDSEGQCFFDDMPNPEMEAIKNLLDTRGSEGWELVQVVFHKEELICMWKREQGDGAIEPQKWAESER